jgi:hypothetical protein
VVKTKNCCFVTSPKLKFYEKAVGQLSEIQIVFTNRLSMDSFTIPEELMIPKEGKIFKEKVCDCQILTLKTLCPACLLF